MLTPMEAPEFKTPDPARAMQVGVGLVSPLWPAFLATAGAGVAYWWMARWVQGEQRAFAPADPAYPLGPPAELTEAVAQAYAEPAEAVIEAAEDLQAEAFETAQDLVEQSAAAGEAVLDQASETVEAAADQSLAAAEAFTDQSLEAGEAAVEQTADVVPIASKPSRAKRERPAE